MFHNRRFTMFHIRMIVFALGLLLAGPVSARGIECPSEADNIRLEVFRDRILGAESTEAAREIAMEQTRLGHRAIARVARALPGDPGLAEAAAVLTAFEDGVMAADSPHEVAGRVDLLMDAQAGRCDYTKTEIVVIIIGFILGILPGILFLFLFC